MSFLEDLRQGLSANPDEVIMDYAGELFVTRGEFARYGEQIVSILEEAGVPRDASAGLVTRNRPLHGAAIVGLLAAERSYTSIYAFQSPDMLARDVRETRFACVIADQEDWTEALRTAVRDIGAVGICLSLEDAPRVRRIDGGGQFTGQDFHRVEGGGIEILSSGTTGKPKRIVFPSHMLVRAVETVKAGQMDDTRPADICTWPFAGIGGLCNLVANIVIHRYMTLLDRFNVPQWLEAVKRHKPSFFSGPPTVTQMLVDADVDPADLASVRYFYGGSAPMPEKLENTLLEKYGIKTIWGYGATEFCGTVISWNVALYDRYYPAKRGAMGKPLPGIEVRVVDERSGEPLGINRVGYLEAKVPSIGEHWIRTTDLALIDEDGFVFHRGRGDGAILRGGFKILPETIVAALVEHQSVLDAAVVGLPDERLGQVPVAVVELKSGAEPVTEDALKGFLRSRLASTAVPVSIRIVEDLPRTPSLKVDLKAVSALFTPSATAAATDR
ncbi:MAG: AMP-dependent synthetase [Porticoccaceae bacterium]|nr:AMP-dependent synthetase [Porticoccaceae bacterium]